MANRYTRKMLSITDCQKNTNRKHNEVSPHTCSKSDQQQDKRRHVSVRIWRKGALVRVGASVSWHSPVENSAEGFKELRLDSATPSVLQSFSKSSHCCSASSATPASLLPLWWSMGLAPQLFLCFVEISPFPLPPCLTRQF